MKSRIVEAIDDGDLNLTFNAGYAKRYEERKRKEELGRLEDKHRETLKKKGVTFAKEVDGSEYSGDSDSESDEEEDEDGELLTPAVDAQILKTLAVIRAKDTTVYDSQTAFFAPEELEETQKQWHGKDNSEKPVREKGKKEIRLKDYHRERLLAGKADQEEEDEKPHLLTPAEEQEQLRRDLKSAIEREHEMDDNENGGFLKKRTKTKIEIAREEDEYKNFLLENLAQTDSARETMAEWLNVRSDKHIDKDERFLIDYVLTRGWIDRDARRTPSYEQIVQEDGALEEEDGKVIEAADEFEAQYNFRFEQPGADQVITYARNVEGSVRRMENPRKAQREVAKAKKESEKQKRSEELKRLKNLKKLEMMEKLHKIQKVSGNVEINAKDIDLETDFDPVAHDQCMAVLFNDDFYGTDETKPEFSDVSDGEDMLAKVLETKPLRKASKIVKKAIMKDQESLKKLPGLLDEYYRLDHEDMIEDLPCRFKYHAVPPSDFGLTPREVLCADDVDLNQFVSLKKLAPYRPLEKQMAEIKKLSRKHRVFQFRKQQKEKLAKKRLSKEKANDNSPDK